MATSSRWDGGLRLAAVDVDHVRDRLEGEEGDPDRENDLDDRHRRPEAEGTEEVVDLGDEEAEVLEDPEQAQVRTRWPR